MSKRHVLGKILASVIVAGVALLLWCGIFVVHTPAGFFQTCADRAGLHFLVLSGGNRGFDVTFNRATHLGNFGGYHQGVLVNALGFRVVVLPRELRRGDEEFSPHAAILLPYWFLAVIAAVAVAWITGCLGWLLTQARLAAGSRIAVGVVLVGFLIINFIPRTAWRPGAAIHPEGMLETLSLIVRPQNHPEIAVHYGFPRECYRTAFIGGRRVDNFHGADLGWDQEKSMENVLTAVVIALAVGLVVHYVKRARVRPTIAPDRSTETAITTR